MHVFGWGYGVLDMFIWRIIQWDHCHCHFWRLNWNNFWTLHIVRLVEFVRLRQRLHVQFRLFFALCFRFFDVIVLPRVHIGWQRAGEVLDASSTGYNCLSVLKHSLSHVASLDTRWEWSIFVPTFDKRSLMGEITIVSNFNMWLRSWGYKFMELLRMSFRNNPWYFLYPPHVMKGPGESSSSFFLNSIPD